MDGSIRWRTSLKDHSYSMIVELLVHDSTVIACSANHLAFLDYATGELRKLVDRDDAAGGIRPTMMLEGDLLYIGSSGAIVCYDLAGNLRWEQPLKGEGHGAVALALPNRSRQADAS